jgi:S1-C subfamily serine protease
LGTPESTEPNIMSRLSSALADAAARIAPSVVQVHGRPRRPSSGIVIAPERVLTTRHSVEWEEGLKVRIDDGAMLEASSAGSDPAADLVLLKVPGLKAPVLTFAASRPRMGELALLAGRSWRGDQRARLGMISGVMGPVQLRDGTRMEQLLVLSPPPYPGFSGSAVVGADGALVGLATAGLLRGTAVALPAAVVTPILREIEQHGGARRGYLGVSSQPVRVPERQRSAVPGDGGLVVLGVVAGSPADRAGLMVGDIMMDAAGSSLRVPEDLLALLTPDRIDRDLDLRVLRGAAAETITVTVGQRPHRS